MDQKRLERIEDKIDKVEGHLSSIDVTLAAQHVSLKEHIRRTEILESDVAPIKTHVNRVEGVIKFIALVATVIGIIETFLHLW